MAGSRESRIVRTGFAEVQREQVRRQSVVFVLRSQCAVKPQAQKNAASRIADHANKVTASCSFRGSIIQTRPEKPSMAIAAMPALIMYRGPCLKQAGASQLSRRCRNAENANSVTAKPAAAPKVVPSNSPALQGLRIAQTQSDDRTVAAEQDDCETLSSRSQRVALAQDGHQHADSAG